MTAPFDDQIIKCALVHELRPFDLKPDAETRAALAERLGIQGIRKLTFSGDVRPLAARDLVLQARLGATVVQTCVVTGDPVTTRIEEAVERQYLADFDAPEADEIEMPEDENADPLPAELDLNDVMSEALALALPPWPRADGVAPVDISVTEPGKTPMTDEDARPFAALKSLTKSRGTEDDG